MILPKSVNGTVCSDPEKEDSVPTWRVNGTVLLTLSAERKNGHVWHSWLGWYEETGTL